MNNSEILPSAVKNPPNNTNTENAFFADRHKQTDGRTDMDVHQTDIFFQIKYWMQNKKTHFTHFH